MPATPQHIKPTDKALKTYYAALTAYSDQHVTHEGALETAFQRLLADTARAHGWLLVPKQGLRVRGKHVIPDGTLRDQYHRRLRCLVALELKIGEFEPESEGEQNHAVEPRGPPHKLRRRWKSSD